MFLALLLRFDVHQHKIRSGKKAGKSNVAKNYFIPTYFAYFCGLVTTIAVMHTFKAAQPALLYLVPYCVIVSFLTAVTRGEVKQLYEYSEDVEESENKNKNKESETLKETDGKSNDGRFLFA